MQDAREGIETVGKATYVQPDTFPPLDSVTGGRSADLFKWLDSRREYNAQAGGLWRIHGGLYNLEEFLEKHPGGAEWLTMTRGTDITEAFEAHHPNIEFVRKNVLPKYHVRDATWPRESPLQFEKGGFYDTLRSRVNERVKALGPGPRRWTDVYADATAVLYEGLLGALSYVGPVAFGPGNPLGLGFGWTAGLVVATGVVGGALVVMGHNYCHMRDNRRMYYINLANGSYRGFRIHHALSHHLYPNTSLDVEYPLFEPTIHFWPELPRRDPNKIMQNVFAFQYLLFSRTPTLFLLKPVLPLLMKRRIAADEYISWFNTLAMVPIRFLAISQMNPSVLESPASIALNVGVAVLQVVFTNAVVYGVSALYGGNIGLYAGHHSDYIWRQGDFTPPRDFGLFQLEATADRVDVYEKGLLPVITTYGDHSLHHLFPTIDHAYHTHLYKDLAQTCDEFNVRFELTNYADMVSGFYRSLWRTYRIEHPRRVGWTGKGYKGWEDPNLGGRGKRALSGGESKEE